ncbi:MAG: AAA family ATPase [Flavobacteriaceae bacterium]
MQQEKENRTNLIFIGGIHGVGKSSICQRVCNDTNIIHLVASDLLRWGEINDTDNKKVEDISFTQDRLITGLKRAIEKNKLYLLDGHFCLFNSKGEIERIPEETFEKINPRIIAIATTSVSKIKMRLEKRDGITYDLDTLNEMQIAEMKYAKKIALKFKIPFFEIKNGKISNLTKTISELN